MSAVTFENVRRAHTKRQVIIKMNKFNMFITAVGVLFLINLVHTINFIYMYMDKSMLDFVLLFVQSNVR